MGRKEGEERVLVTSVLVLSGAKGRTGFAVDRARLGVSEIVKEDAFGEAELKAGRSEGKVFMHPV